MKFFNIFLIFAQNIECGYTLEPPQWGYVLTLKETMSCPLFPDSYAFS